MTGSESGVAGRRPIHSMPPASGSVGNVSPQVLRIASPRRIVRRRLGRRPVRPRRRSAARRRAASPPSRTGRRTTGIAQVERIAGESHVVAAFRLQPHFQPEVADEVARPDPGGDDHPVEGQVRALGGDHRNFPFVAMDGDDDRCGRSLPAGLNPAAQRLENGGRARHHPVVGREQRVGEAARSGPEPCGGPPPARSR